ncbi:MAG: hypothetical protein AAF821_11460, partial [Cyanobacteria bacterium P01_D01_bin.156]
MLKESTKTLLKQKHFPRTLIHKALGVFSRLPIRPNSTLELSIFTIFGYKGFTTSKKIQVYFVFS